MADFNSNLNADLVEKLQQIKWRLEQPALFIAEHFASIRNEIDLDFERLIDDLRDAYPEYSATRKADLNALRTKFIEFLDKKETSLFETLPVSLAFEAFDELEKRVDEFMSLNEHQNVEQVEENYVQLALNLIDATNELERRLLDNQTFAFMPSKNSNETGKLIFLSEDFLNRQELRCFKFFKSGLVDEFRFVHETIHVSLNSSLVVGSSRPCVLTRNALIIVNILNQFELLSEIIFEFSDRESLRTLKIDSFLSLDCFDAVSLSANASRISTSSFNVYNNRLSRFEIADSIVCQLDGLDLRDNQLEELNSQQLAKATKLRKLFLANACLPSTKFSFDFLFSLTELTKLELTLPDVLFDFSVFMNLTKLLSLKLNSTASCDANFKRPKLEIVHFKHLFSASKLKQLDLSYFEIGSLCREMLSGFGELDFVILNDNCIAHVDNDSLSILAGRFDTTLRLQGNSLVNLSSQMFQRLSSLVYLDLSFNRIQRLRADLFAELSSLKYLYLNNNFIDRIERGSFRQLKRLEILQLDENPIVAIDADSFEGLANLAQLSLENCALKSIDNTMFNGLKDLTTLDLNNNDIEHVKENSFFGLDSLNKLSLRGNKIERLDLNCFCNLTELSALHLSNNRISELNDQIRPGVLSNLNIFDLSENRLVRISSAAFSESRRLKFLRLFGNKLERLDEDFFRPFQALERLEMHDNRLFMEVTEKTFAACVNLNLLSLYDNPGVRVKDGALRELKNLRNIRLELGQSGPQSSERFIESIQDSSFSSKIWNFSLINSSISNLNAFKMDANRFSSLKRLDLTRNLISKLDRVSLAGLIHLTQLDLCGNLIEALDDPTVFQDLLKLKDLRLSENQMKYIHRRVFKGVYSLESLDLSNNSLLSKLDSGIFRGMLNLVKLFLAGNNLVSFDLASLFRSCRRLKYLDLSNNKLDNDSVNEASMSGTTAQNLKELILGKNRLENMNFVRNLYRLEKLDLSGNKIESVTSNGVNLLGRLMHLKHVDLSNNQIELLDIKAIFSHLIQTVQFIDVSNNPFNQNAFLKCTKNFHVFIEKR